MRQHQFLEYTNQKGETRACDILKVFLAFGFLSFVFLQTCLIKSSHIGKLMLRGIKQVSLLKNHTQ